MTNPQPSRSPFNSARTFMHLFHVERGHGRHRLHGRFALRFRPALLLPCLRVANANLSGGGFGRTRLPRFVSRARNRLFIVEIPVQAGAPLSCPEKAMPRPDDARDTRTKNTASSSGVPFGWGSTRSARHPRVVQARRDYRSNFTGIDARATASAPATDSISANTA